MKLKRIIRAVIIFIFPFLLLTLINELSRPKSKEKSYITKGIKAINPVIKVSNKCTWACHNNTAYCKQNHVKYLNKYYNYTDYFYFGIINSLHSTGSYRKANVFILVVLIPLLIIMLTVKLLKISEEIKALKKKR